MDNKTTHGGKREGAGRKASGKVRSCHTLTLSPEATEKLKSMGRDKSEYIDRLILTDINNSRDMEKRISKREALIYICETFTDYAKNYDDYDDGYGLSMAISVINNVSGDYITAEDVEGRLTPYTDALWEYLSR